MVAPVAAVALPPVVTGGAVVAPVSSGGSVLIPLALTGIAVGGAAVAGGALGSWRAWSAVRIPEIQAEGKTYREAQRQAGREYKQQQINHNEGDKVTTKAKGSPKMTASIPLVVQAVPDEAAAWDIAQGVVDFLLTNASEETDYDAFARISEETYRRAKGLESDADELEYRMGQTIGSTILRVLAREGLTWEQLSPPQIAGRVVRTSSGTARLPQDNSTPGSDLIERVPSIGDVDGDGDDGGVPLIQLVQQGVTSPVTRAIFNKITGGN